jgi:hypothetical protein
MRCAERGDWNGRFLPYRFSQLADAFFEQQSEKVDVDVRMTSLLFSST